MTEKKFSVIFYFNNLLYYTGVSKVDIMPIVLRRQKRSRIWKDLQNSLDRYK